MKNKIKSIIICITIAFIFLGLIYILGETYIKSEKIDDLYIKMKEIHDNKSLIGLSKKQVVEILGKPMETYKYNNVNQEIYMYNAGVIYKGLIWGDHNIWTKKHNYVLKVNFERTENVQSTEIKERP